MLVSGAGQRSGLVGHTETVFPVTGYEVSLSVLMLYSPLQHPLFEASFTQA